MRRIRRFGMVFGFIGLATTGVAQLAARRSQSDANTATVKRLTEEFLNQGRGEVLTELYAADAIHHTPLGDLTVKGRQDTRGALGLAIPDFKVTILSLTANDQWISVLYQFTGTFSGKLPMPDGSIVPGNNAPIQMPLGTFYRFSDRGQIAQSWELYDNLHFSMSMGLLPASRP